MVLTIYCMLTFDSIYIKVNVKVVSCLYKYKDQNRFDVSITLKQNRSTEVCSKLKSPERRQVQERLVSTLEHMQVPKWDRTRCPEE